MTGSSSGENFGYTGTNYSQIPISGDYSSLNFPDSYQATPKPDSNFKENYDYDYEKLSGPTHDIENIRLMIKAQKPGTISAVADYWIKVVQLLDTVRDTVAQNADALHGGNNNGFGGWTSPAADEFLRWGPGASLYSIRQWTDAANANVRALRKLSDAVLQAHRDIDDAWTSYVAEAKADKAKLLQGWAFDPSTLPVDQQKKLPGPSAQLMSQIYEHQTAIWRKWSLKAQGIAYELSQKYYVQLEGDLAKGRGTRFEGPANAVVDDPFKANMPGAPGGPGPGGPAPGGPPPGSAPPPAKGGGSPLTGGSPPPTSLRQLAELAKQAQLVALAPPPATAVGLSTPVPLPAAPPGGPLLSPATAMLLGLAPPPGAAPSGGLFGGSTAGTAGSTQGLTGPGSATGAPALKNLFSKSGVLRSGSGMTSPTESAPPGGLGRAGLSRPNALSRGGEPESLGGRRAGSRGVAGEHEARPGAPGYGEQEAFGRSSSFRATSPVLGGRHTTGSPGNPMADEPPGQIRGVRPGTTPSVLQGGKSGRGKGASPVSGVPVDEQFGPASAQPGTTAPVLGSPAARLRGPAPVEPLDEIPRGLRGARSSAGSGQPATGPSELSSRRRVQPDQRAKDEAAQAAQEQDISRVVGDEEAWSVQTPGGPVLTSRTEQPAYQVEHRPALGGGGS